MAAFLDGDGDDAPLADVAKFIERGLFDRALFCGKENFPWLRPGDVLLVGSGRDRTRIMAAIFSSAFNSSKLQDARPPAARTGLLRVRDFMHALDIDAPGVGGKNISK